MDFLPTQQNGRRKRLNVTKFTTGKSTYIYDTVVARYSGIMKKYLHTARHSM